MDPYKVLGLSLGASQNEIKKAFKEKCLLYHPDRPGDDPAKFREVREAYELIQNGPSTVPDRLYMDRCRYYRNQLKDAPVGDILDDPYPEIKGYFSLLWKLTFSRKKLSKSVNAKIQTDLSWELSFFLYSAVPHIPTDCPASESVIRLARLVRRFGGTVILFTTLDFPNCPKDVNKQQLCMNIIETENEYRGSEGFIQSSRGIGLEIYPETQELVNSYSDFLAIRSYLEELFPVLNTRLED